MPSLEVPDGVADNVLARWPDRGALWLTTAVDQILALCDQYSALPERVFPARFALVVAATRPVGPSLVLRSTADPNGPGQAAAAQMLAELGVGPQIHEAASTAASTCVVMDKIQPGTPGTGCTIAELAELLRPLVSQADGGSTLPPISAWLRERLTGGIEHDLDPGMSNPAEFERAQATALLDELEADEAAAVCHGDVSLGNVLRGWNRLYLIDPRGMRGDLEYDAAVASIKAGVDVRALARRLHVDVARADAWATVAAAARV